MVEENIPISLELTQIKLQFLDRIMCGLMVLAIVGLPLSLMRWFTFGFLPIYIVHLVLSVLIVTLFIRRKKASPKIISATILIVMAGAGLSALFSFGFMGGGSSLILFTILFISILWDIKIALIFTVLYACLMGLAGYGFSSGLLNYSISPEIYLKTPIAWGVTILSNTIVAAFLVVAIHGFLSSLKKLTRQIAKQNEEIDRLANHDALTGLPTLRLANEKIKNALAMAKRNDAKAALLFLDLDGFKDINDKYGHDAGDKILKNVADKIRVIIREGDTPCRIGGDEFLVLLPQTNGDEEVVEVCKRIIAIVAEPIKFQSSELVVGVSIGAALYPDHAQNSKTLRKAADKAMYQVKRSGKNGFILSSA